ncbi:Casein kinase II subunit beta [Spironucleus salmonicida]|uniref:Casein kinase II subunit beta n=1 Tax=Spironucleus salmonicida TaxID=348837 RepID=V6LQY0_9EUKA|nr:Casein kinase II subunit beta [Spironucleus salmonicida]|eukprot:EST47000.1 Casein kinase II beta chain [Spironucleus salmonicida]
MPFQLSSSASTSYYSDQGTWLEQFLQKSEFNHILVQVPDTYFQESLALLGLEKIEFYSQAIQLILYDNYDCQPSEQEIIENAACIVYALAHQRYIRTPQGLQDTLQLFQNGAYGRCPRIRCGAGMLVYGEHLMPGEGFLKNYCPKCKTLYDLTQYDEFCVDGCFYGPDFIGMFVATYLELADNTSLEEKKKELFGFEIVK